MGCIGRCSMKVTPSSLMLNASCLNYLNADFVEILFNPIEKLIAIRPANEFTPGAVRWKKVKDGKDAPCVIGCSAFTTLVYELMQWPKLWNTTILAMVYQKRNQVVMFFDLTQTEISALPYMKQKPKKKRSSTDVYYDIEAMIAQQLELLHNKKNEIVTLQEQEDETEDVPSPKRKKLHPSAWKDNFGQESSAAVVGCRHYQYEVMHQWDVDAGGVPVEGFDLMVSVDPDEMQTRIAELKPAPSKDDDK